MSEKITSKSDLSIRQRKFIKLYLETGNATLAAKKVYRCKNDNSAAATGSEVLRNLNLDDLLEVAGLSDKILIDKLKAGLESTGLYGKDGIEHTDFETIRKYIETIFKLKGKFIEKKDVKIKGKLSITDLVDEDEE